MNRMNSMNWLNLRILKDLKDLKDLMYFRHCHLGTALLTFDELDPYRVSIWFSISICFFRVLGSINFPLHLLQWHATLLLLCIVLIKKEMNSIEFESMIVNKIKLYCYTIIIIIIIELLKLK